MANVVAATDLPGILADLTLRLQRLEAQSGVFTRAGSASKSTDGASQIVYTLPDPFANTGLEAVVGLGSVGSSGGIGFVYIFYNISLSATTLSFGVNGFVSGAWAAVPGTLINFTYIAVGN